MTLPNFIVIGAPKAGTTSLHRYLRSHPEVFMPEHKELDFFVAEHNWDRGLRWYEGWFDDAGESVVAIGEASPRYTMYPAFKGVPARIAELLPDAKLIYVVRDPVPRMISHWQHIARLGRADPDPATALLTDPVYLDTSRYGMQLERYLEHFSRDQILVVVSEQLRRDRSGTVEGILGFLGAEPTLPSDGLEDEYNVTAGQQAPRSFMRSLMRVPGWSHVAYSLPVRMKAGGRRFTHHPQEPVMLPADVRHELEARLRDDVALLRSYVATPGFDGWGIA